MNTTSNTYQQKNDTLHIVLQQQNNTIDSVYGLKNNNHDFVFHVFIDSQKCIKHHMVQDL